jgi:hypothetical protein
MKQFYITHRDADIGEMDEYNAGQFVQAQLGTDPPTRTHQEIIEEGPLDRAERNGEVTLRYSDLYGKPCWMTIRYIPVEPQHSNY